MWLVGVATAVVWYTGSRTHPVSLRGTQFIMTRTGPSSSSYIQSLVDVAMKIHRTQGQSASQAVGGPSGGFVLID